MAIGSENVETTEGSENRKGFLLAFSDYRISRVLIMLAVINVVGSRE